MASIGMTARNCWKKYGKVKEERKVGDTEVVRKYLSAGFEVHIFFAGSLGMGEEKAFRIAFRKLPSDWSPEAEVWRGAHIPAEQMKSLLSESSDNKKWLGTATDGFRSEDGTLIASLDPSTNELVIEVLKVR